MIIFASAKASFGQNLTCEPCTKSAEKVGNILSSQLEIQESLKLYKSAICQGENMCEKKVEKLVPAVIVAVLNQQKASQVICNSTKVLCDSEVGNCKNCTDFIGLFSKVKRFLVLRSQMSWIILFHYLQSLFGTPSRNHLESLLVNGTFCQAVEGPVGTNAVVECSKFVKLNFEKALTVASQSLRTKIPRVCATLTSEKC